LTSAYDIWQIIRKNHSINIRGPPHPLKLASYAIRARTFLRTLADRHSCTKFVKVTDYSQTRPSQMVRSRCCPLLNALLFF